MGETNTESGRLSAADIEAVARRVLELVTDLVSSGSEARFVDAADLAAILGVDRDWVYSHAAELGALRLGGPGGRLRFDLREVRRALDGPGGTRTSRKERGARFQRVPLLDFER